METNNKPQKSYDISQILSVSRGDNGFVQTMIKMFVVQTPLYINKIDDYHQNGNLAEMGEEAHKLKPSIYAMGMHDMKKAVIEIVSAGRKNEDSAELSVYIQQLKTASEKVIAELKTDFSL